MSRLDTRNVALIALGVLIAFFPSVNRIAVCDDAPESLDAAPLASSSIKMLGSAAPQATQPNMIMGTPIAPPASLPAEKLPQYRIELPQQNEAEATFEDGQIQFAITHPDLLAELGRPLRVKAKVHIDGRPFNEVRSAYAESAQTVKQPPLMEQLADLVDAVVASVPEPTPDADETEPASESDPASENQKEEDKTADDTDEEDGEDSTPTINPATIEPYRMTTAPDETMRRFAEAVGDDLSDVESNWLLSHWTLGPPLLVVHPYFQSFRSDQRPAFDVLDRDRDGTVSQQELSQSVESFNKCDANRDEVVDAMELAKAADNLKDPAHIPLSNGPLLWLSDDLIGIQESDPLLYETVRSLDKDQDGSISESEVNDWSTQAADIELLVNFTTSSPESARVDVIAIGKGVSANVVPAENSNGINVAFETVTIRLCGIQESPSPELANTNSGQVSLGAIVDGYPLLPNLDPNDDGRFTIRELRELEQLLRAFDRDGDQSITRSEATPPIRVCIGLGPTAHRELANVRDTSQPTNSPIVTAPEWFQRMDRNLDNDLSRREFPGTDEQFRSLDADGDDLIDAGEAQTFEQSAE